MLMLQLTRKWALFAAAVLVCAARALALADDSEGGSDRLHCSADDESCSAGGDDRERGGGSRTCIDSHERCESWASQGECKNNAPFMTTECPLSCGTCLDEETSENAGGTDDSECEDMYVSCRVWAEMGHCRTNFKNMHEYCPNSCGVCEGGSSSSDIVSELNLDGRVALRRASKRYGMTQLIVDLDSLTVVRDMVDYMPDDVRGTEPTAGDLSSYQKDSCWNRNELCAIWAAAGECTKSRSDMIDACAPVCKSCHLLRRDDDARCPPLDPSVEPALTPGGLNRMFERIMELGTKNGTTTDDVERPSLLEYSVTVLSSPNSSPSAESPDGGNDDDGREQRAAAPWIIALDGFLSDDECRRVIDAGYDVGYERSLDSPPDHDGEPFEGEFHDRRTSEAAWCGFETGCRADPAVAAIHERIETVLGIPAENGEDLQILKYEAGQRYEVHHDYVPELRRKRCGPRILTVLMYLNDVEAGGETRFPELGVAVAPKKGRALIWPSVRDSDPREWDERTVHEALPVERGTKFAANSWIHLYNYVDEYRNGCA